MRIDLFRFQSYVSTSVRVFKANACRRGEVQDKWRKGVDAAASSGAFQMLCKGCETFFFFCSSVSAQPTKVPVVNTTPFVCGTSWNIRKHVHKQGANGLTREGRKGQESLFLGVGYKTTALHEGS